MAVSKRTRYEVLRRDNHACRYCGQMAPDVKLTVDHVMPVAHRSSLTYGLKLSGSSSGDARKKESAYADNFLAQWNSWTDETFRYFCGCIWRLVTEMQDAAKALLDTEATDG